MRSPDHDAKPRLRWLLYAHSPLQDRKRVQITIPDYGSITIDVTHACVFYFLNEQKRK